MSIELFLLLALAVGCQCACGGQASRSALASERQLKIINGAYAQPNQFPYAAYITMELPAGLAACTGSVIAPKTILTAAHCLASSDNIKFPLGGFTAYVGHIDHQKARKIRIVKSITHSQFYFNNKTGSFYDIGILKTATVLNTGNVATACIASHRSPLDHDYGPAAAFGWGIIDGKVKIETKHLLFIQLNVLKHADCQQRQPAVTEGHLCGYSDKGAMCEGDSGGGFSSVGSGGKHVIIGVTSFSHIYCPIGKEHPEVFTRVSAYETWIVQTAGDDGRHICRQ